MESNPALVSLGEVIVGAQIGPRKREKKRPKMEEIALLFWVLETFLFPKRHFITPR